MDLAPALAFARRHRNAVLVTIGADGRPQSTNVVYALDDDDVVRVSITADRVKARNLRRDARASLHVSSDDFWSYVVLEAEADLTPVAAAPDLSLIHI